MAKGGYIHTYDWAAEDSLTPEQVDYLPIRSKLMCDQLELTARCGLVGAVLHGQLRKYVEAREVVLVYDIPAAAQVNQRWVSRQSLEWFNPATTKIFSAFSRDPLADKRWIDVVAGPGQPVQYGAAVTGSSVISTISGTVFVTAYNGQYQIGVTDENKVRTVLAQVSKAIAARPVTIGGYRWNNLDQVNSLCQVAANEVLATWQHPVEMLTPKWEIVVGGRGEYMRVTPPWCMDMAKDSELLADLDSVVQYSELPAASAEVKMYCMLPKSRVERPKFGRSITARDLPNLLSKTDETDETGNVNLLPLFPPKGGVINYDPSHKDGRIHINTENGTFSVPEDVWLSPDITWEAGTVLDRFTPIGFWVRQDGTFDPKMFTSSDLQNISDSAVLAEAEEFNDVFVVPAHHVDTLAVLTDAKGRPRTLYGVGLDNKTVGDSQTADAMTVLRAAPITGSVVQFGQLHINMVAQDHLSRARRDPNETEQKPFRGQRGGKGNRNRGDHSRQS